jgi:hypothetical protein
MGQIVHPASGPVYVDTNAVIYAVEQIEPYRTASAPLWEALNAGSLLTAAQPMQRVPSSEGCVSSGSIRPSCIGCAAVNNGRVERVELAGSAGQASSRWKPGIGDSVSQYPAGDCRNGMHADQPGHPGKCSSTSSEPQVANSRCNPRSLIHEFRLQLVRNQRCGIQAGEQP